MVGVSAPDRETVGHQARQRFHSDVPFGRLKAGERLRSERLRDPCGTRIPTLRELLDGEAADPTERKRCDRALHDSPVLGCRSAGFLDIPGGQQLCLFQGIVDLRILTGHDVEATVLRRELARVERVETH